MRPSDLLQGVTHSITAIPTHNLSLLLNHPLGTASAPESVACHIVVLSLLSFFPARLLLGSIPTIRLRPFQN